MGKILTFRGTMTAADNARILDHEVFKYEGPDLTKAWKVKEFYLWPKTIRAETGSTEGQWVLASSLATDVLGSVGFDSIMSTEDNRQIAWVNKGYFHRDSPIGDFLTGVTGLFDTKGVVDPGHIVNNGLYINMYTTSDSTTSPTRDYNYLIVLEEVKISENEAILQLIKGVAQDIDN
jgi:hypothetical protein